MTDKNIPTIILCGGIGMRLKEETEFKPKPMVEIGGKPILWHIMKIYAHCGYKDFILPLGYKGDQIKDYFLRQNYYERDFSLNTGECKEVDFLTNGEVSQDNFNIIFAATGVDTPHGERVLKIKNYVKGDLFMVTYGDGVADIDISKLVEFHKQKGKMATITGIHPVSRWGLINADENGLITKLDQKPALYDYINGGFMVFNKEIFDYMKEGDMIEDVLSRLIPEKEVAMYKHEGFWYGMDTYRDFLYLNDLWEKDKPWAFWEKR